MPIPSAYATNAAATPSPPEPVTAPAVTARNGAIVQDSEASAKDTPYPTWDHQAAVGADPWPASRGIPNERPASSQPPSPTSRTSDHEGDHRQVPLESTRQAVRAPPRPARTPPRTRASCRRRSAPRGRSPTSGPPGRIAGHQQPEIGRQQREAARVERRHRARDQRERQRARGHRLPGQQGSPRPRAARPRPCRPGAAAPSRRCSPGRTPAGRRPRSAATPIRRSRRGGSTRRCRCRRRTPASQRRPRGPARRGSSLGPGTRRRPPPRQAPRPGTSLNTASRTTAAPACLPAWRRPAIAPSRVGAVKSSATTVAARWPGRRRGRRGGEPLPGAADEQAASVSVTSSGERGEQPAAKR